MLFQYSLLDACRRGKPLRRLERRGQAVKRKIIAKIENALLIIASAVMATQSFVAVALFACDGWNKTWLPIQVEAFAIGMFWNIAFFMANFPDFERRREH